MSHRTWRLLGAVLSLMVSITFVLALPAASVHATPAGITSATANPTAISPTVSPGVNDTTLITVLADAGQAISAVIVPTSPPGATAVRTLGLTESPAGTYTATWDGKDDASNNVAEGQYVGIIASNDGSGADTDINHWALISVDASAPTAPTVIVSPAIVNASTTLQAIVTDTLMLSNIKGAEYFIDSVGADGSGVAMTPATPAAQARLFSDSVNTSVLSEGAHTLYVHGEDVQDLWGPTASASISVDHTPPTVTNLSATPLAFSPNFSPGVQDTTTLGYTLADNMAPSLTAFVLVVDPNSQATVRTLVTNTVQAVGAHTVDWNGRDDGSNFVPDGPYPVAFFAIDQAGNTSTITFTLTIVDNTPPTTTLLVGTPQFTDTSSRLWVTSATQHLLVGDDGPVGSGVKETWYRFYPTGGPAPAYTQGITFTITGADGQYTIDYYSVDNAGNTEAVKTAYEWLDNTPPTSSVGTLLAYQTGTVFPVPFTASDSGSGVLYVELWARFRSDSTAAWSPWTLVGAGLTSPIPFAPVAGPGMYEFFTIGIDNVLNREPAKSVAEAKTRAVPVIPGRSQFFYGTYRDTSPDDPQRGSKIALWVDYIAKSFQFFTRDFVYAPRTNLGTAMQLFVNGSSRQLMIRSIDPELAVNSYFIELGTDTALVQLLDRRRFTQFVLYDPPGTEVPY